MSRKTTVNLSDQNSRKISQIAKKTGRNQSDLINNAIAEMPVIDLGNQKNLASCFFDLRRALEQKKFDKVHEEVEEVCRSLNLLMEKIEELVQSRKG